MKRFFNRVPKTTLRLGAIALLLFVLACNGDDEGAQRIDCAEEEALLGIAEDSDQGGMTVQFEISYTGDLSVREVTWDFGDGTKGSGPAVAHLYINSGTYPVTAIVELGRGDTTCIAESTTSVTIQ